MTIWSAQIGQRDIMFLFEGRTTNAYGRTFHRGKSIEKDMRSLIIDDILSGGGNVSTEYYPGCFRAIGSKYKASGVAVSNVWKTFCQMGENLSCLAVARRQPKRLAEPELDLVQPLINEDLRELTRALIKENIQAPSLATAAISTIGCAVRDRFRQKGK